MIALPSFTPHRLDGISPLDRLPAKGLACESGGGIFPLLVGLMLLGKPPGLMSIVTTAAGLVSRVILSKMRKPEKSLTSGTEVDRMVKEVMLDQLESKLTVPVPTKVNVVPLDATISHTPVAGLTSPSMSMLDNL